MFRYSTLLKVIEFLYKAKRNYDPISLINDYPDLSIFSLIFLGDPITLISMIIRIHYFRHQNFFTFLETFYQFCNA